MVIVATASFSQLQCPPFKRNSIMLRSAAWTTATKVAAVALTLVQVLVWLVFALCMLRLAWIDRWRIAAAAALWVVLGGKSSWKKLVEGLKYHCTPIHNGRLNDSVWLFMVVFSVVCTVKASGMHAGWLTW
ncbi:hypothetical protein DYB38_010323 [Aphanomyces astaci]|uniref:Uncharacterized protein n=2 Tax=Aphanomyces astaci TaxID=112090 RepID=A0A397D8N6_APHAT|nr:hypothetical protein DYB38_010323 [Aphanomyces astaci]